MDQGQSMFLFYGFDHVFLVHLTSVAHGPVWIGQNGVFLKDLGWVLGWIWVEFWVGPAIAQFGQPNPLLSALWFRKPNSYYIPGSTFSVLTERGGTTNFVRLLWLTCYIPGSTLLYWLICPFDWIFETFHMVPSDYLYADVF